MRNFRFNYLVGALLLATLYAFSLESSGYRLPRYYTPDGEIMPFGGNAGREGMRAIMEINGQAPDRAPVLHPSDAPIIVRSDMGLSLVHPRPESALRILLDFKVFVAFSFIYLLCGFWFLESGKDVHLAAFCFILSGILFTSVFSFSYQRFNLLSQLLIFMLIPAILNLGLRTTGKEVPGYLLLGEIVALVFVTLVGYVGINNLETIQRLKLAGRGLIYLVPIFVLFLQLENAVRPTEDPIEKRKRWLLLFGTALGFWAPAALFGFRDAWLPGGDPFSYVWPLMLLFPLSLLYGTYRIQLVPFQFVLTHSILIGMLTVFFVLVYGVVLLLHNLLLPEEEPGARWIVHLVLILTLVFFLDPARRRFASWLQRKVFRMDARLTESLEKIARLISSPIHIQSVVADFQREVRETLGLEKVNLLLSDSTFPGLVLKGEQLLRIQDNSPIWRILKPEKITVTSYLTYGAGARGMLYRYLLRNEFYLAMGIGGPRGMRSGFRGVTGGSRNAAHEGEALEVGAMRAALLIGYKKKHIILKLAEIRYLQEAARLAGMMIHNYSILVQEVRKRRRMRDLFIAGQVQRSLQEPGDTAPQGVRLAYFSQPVISVTGDYVDMFSLSRNMVAFVLGDVSGHGLGTGYLVSTFRSMMRSHLESGASLTEAVDVLNRFLIGRYRGSEFITLFALLLNTDTGEMEYINAAHPGPYLSRDGSSDVERLRDSQRLLGLLRRPYTPSALRLGPGDRLYLFSDGVTETFNPEQEPFGDGRLHRFLRRSLNLPADDITRHLKANLAQFRQSEALNDDTTFVVLEYNPTVKPLRNLLSFLGLEQREPAR